MQELRAKREKYAISIRKRDFHNLQNQHRQKFIIKYDPQYQSNVGNQWISLVKKLLPAQSPYTYIPLLKSMKLHSRTQAVCNLEHPIELFYKLQVFLREEYDQKEQQNLTTWILSHLCYSNVVNRLLGNETNILEQLLRRFSVQGDLDTKDNCLWIFNHIIRQKPSLKQSIVASNFVNNLISYYKQDPVQTQIFESLRSVLYLIYDTKIFNYHHFKPLTRWFLEFCNLNNKQIIYFCVSCISLMSDLQYGILIINEISKWYFLKKINIHITYLKSVENQMASNFIVAFINITRKYFANTCFHEEMLNQVNILRTFRLILVLENVGEYVQHAVFEAIIDYTDEIAFCERIVKDELFSMLLEFYLKSQGAIHISVLKCVVNLILSLTKVNQYCQDLQKVKELFIRDLNDLQELSLMDEYVKELTHKMEIAVAQIDTLIEGDGRGGVWGGNQNIYDGYK